MPGATSLTRSHASATPAQSVTPAPTPHVPTPAPSNAPWIQAAPPPITLSGSSTSTSTTSASAGGEPLAAGTRQVLERSYQTNLQSVRVHTDAKAHDVAHSLSTRAVTYGSNIFLGSGERPTDLRVMAHEAAHVVQQRGAPAMQRFSPGHGDAQEHEAEQASAAVLRGESFAVQQQTSGPRVQGFLGIELPNPLNWLADKANIIPGFRMFTIILGVNPINMSPVARSAANILRALIEFLPGGGLITQALDNSGVFEKAGAFVEAQIASLGMAGSAIKAAVTAFISSLGLSDLANLGGVWERAKQIFTDPIDRIKSFGIGLVTGIITLIKDAILKPIAKMAEGTEGYNLLKGILGKDPITGDPVTRSAETLLGPLLKMVGLGDVWQRMQTANAIPRCWAWFQSTMAGLLAIVTQIPPSFIAAFKSLTLEDIILIPKAFIKLGKVFVGFVGKFVSWGVDAMWKLLEIVFEVVSPGAFGYIKKTGAALKSILKNPLPFVGNLVKAAKLGFTNFAGNFGTHLKAGLLDWLTGSLPGIYIPRSFSLGEIVKFVFSVLGLTWANLRQKLVKAVGETAVRAMEVGFDIVKTLVTQGPAAAWDKIQAQLSALKDQVISGIIDMVVGLIVTRAVPKLIAMFIPGAGFISAILSIYGTVMVFVNKISKIIQVVTGFINSIVAIAAGNIGAAASKVEGVLAGLLSLAINFLAGFAGLGRVADKVMVVINKVRAPIDKALDAVINWIVTMAKKLGKFVKSAGQSAMDLLFEWWKNKAPFSDKKGKSHKLLFSGTRESARLKVASAEMFTEEFIAKVEKVFAEDALAKSFALPYLGQSKQKKQEIDKLKTQLEREKKTKEPGAKFTDQRLKSAMMEMAAIMGPLFDVLPENKVDDLPVKPGDSVTLPYKGTERMAEILFASTERVNYEVKSLSAKMLFTTADFKAKWAAGQIRPYIEKGSREEYLGATPGKASASGKVVIARYKTKVEKNVVLVEWQTGKWWPLADCDMSHEPVDAVDFWLDEARPKGWVPKGPEIRAWMLNAKNYVLEPSAENRSRGSRNKRKYLPP